MTYLPDLVRAQMLKLGVATEDIQGVWEDHVAMVDADGKGENYGGKRLFGLCQSHVQRASEQAVMATVQRQRDERAAEDKRRKDAEDAAYQREAISFPAYLDSLITKRNKTAAEHVLVGAGSPRPGETPWAFLDRAFSKDERRKQIAEADRDGLDPPPPIVRDQRCACGAPVASWVSNGRRYWAGQCRACVNRERGKDGAR